MNDNILDYKELWYYSGALKVGDEVTFIRGCNAHNGAIRKKTLSTMRIEPHVQGTVIQINRVGEGLGSGNGAGISYDVALDEDTLVRHVPEEVIAWKVIEYAPVELR